MVEKNTPLIGINEELMNMNKQMSIYSLVCRVVYWCKVRTN